MALAYNSTKSITKATLDAASLAATGAVRSGYAGLAYKKEGTNEFLWVVERTFPWVYCFKNGVRDTTKEISNGVLNSYQSVPGLSRINITPDAIGYITYNNKNYILINDDANKRTWSYLLGDSSASFSGDLGNPLWNNPSPNFPIKYSVGSGLTTKGNFFYSAFRGNNQNTIIDYYRIGNQFSYATEQDRRVQFFGYDVSDTRITYVPRAILPTGTNPTGLTTDGTYFYVLDRANNKVIAYQDTNTNVNNPATLVRHSARDISTSVLQTYNSSLLLLGMVVDDSGGFYFIDYNSTSIIYFDDTPETRTSAIATFGALEARATGSIIENKTRTIQHNSSKGISSTVLSQLNSNFEPTGIAHLNNKIFVLDNNSQKVFAFNSDYSRSSADDIEKATILSKVKNYGDPYTFIDIDFYGLVADGNRLLASYRHHYEKLVTLTGYNNVSETVTTTKQVDTQRTRTVPTTKRVRKTRRVRKYSKGKKDKTSKNYNFDHYYYE